MMRHTWSSNVVVVPAIFLAACGGAAGAPPPTTVSAAPVAAPAPTPACTVFARWGHSEFRLSPRGLVVDVYENSDNAGTQYEQRYLYDDRGRAVRIRGESIEGMGETGPIPEVTVSYTEDPAARWVEARYSDGTDGELLGVVRERWTFDERGLPIRREQYDGEDPAPRVVTCAYDARGRPVARNDERFVYRGGEVVPVEVVAEDVRATVVSAPHMIRIRAVWEDEAQDGEDTAGPEPDPEDEEDEDPLEDDEDADLAGSCHDFLFRPCSPVFAPPPPGRERATLPRP